MNSLFHDMPHADAEKWQSHIQVQPLMEQWQVLNTYCGWREVPSTYILSEQDRLIPAAFQEQLAGLAGSKVVRVDGGHLAILSRAEEVARTVIEEAKALS